MKKAILFALIAVIATAAYGCKCSQKEIQKCIKANEYFDENRPGGPGMTVDAKSPAMIACLDKIQGVCKGK